MLEVNRCTLPNGLRIVHNHQPDTAMVAMNVLYATGARDEQGDLTGLAHLFEHLMFGGSANAPDFDKALTAASGTDNAWTSNDFTAFWTYAPRQNAETLFYLESDRMLSPTLSNQSLEVQRSVVTEEFKQQCLDRPYGRNGHLLRKMLYPARHPYSWPVIGKEPGHIAKATQCDVRRWFDSNFAPANAVVAVAGNITWAEVQRLAHKWFAPVAARPAPVRNLPSVPPLAAPIETVDYQEVPQTLITMAWLMDHYGTRAYHAADAITDILANGRAARFHQLLVSGPGAQMFSSLDASISGSEHAGFLMVNGRLKDETVDVDQAKAFMAKQVGALAAQAPPTADEVERMRTRQKSLFVMGNLDCLSRVQTIAMAEIHGEDPDAALNTYLTLTPAEIAGTARQIFSRPAATLVVRPKQ